jgi:hypothetical protein
LKLRAEGFITLGGQGEMYEPFVWLLTKKGFEAIADELGELSERRFKPHSIPHDAWVLAFQLGSYLGSVPYGVTICTEQQYRCFDSSLLPDWLPAERNHIPDGFTQVISGSKTALYGIEVELHLKPIDRYDSISSYYDGQELVHHVLWLTGTAYIGKKIRERLTSLDALRLSSHNFILLEDFKKDGWSAKIVSGDLKDFSIRQLMFPTGHQLRTNHAPKANQPRAIDYFLSTARSPKIFKG